MAVAPDDTTYKFKLPTQIAWAAARGIAKDTHFGVVLLGEYGIAAFASDGSGSGEVHWNSKSTMPGETSRFGPNTTVCIN